MATLAPAGSPRGVAVCRRVKQMRLAIAQRDRIDAEAARSENYGAQHAGAAPPSQLQQLRPRVRRLQVMCLQALRNFPPVYDEIKRGKLREANYPIETCEMIESELRNLKREVCVHPAMNRYLASYQRDGIRFMYGAWSKGTGCILADDSTSPRGSYSPASSWQSRSLHAPTD